MGKFIKPYEGKLSLKQKISNYWEDFTKDSWRKKGVKIIGSAALLAVAGFGGVKGYTYLNNQLKNKNIELKTEKKKSSALITELIAIDKDNKTLKKDKEKIKTEYVTKIKEISKDIRGSYQPTIDYNVPLVNDDKIFFYEIFNKPTKETRNEKLNRENYAKSTTTLTQIISVFPKLKKYEKDLLEGKYRMQIVKRRGSNSHKIYIMEAGEYDNFIARIMINSKKLKRLKQRVRYN